MTSVVAAPLRKFLIALATVGALAAPALAEPHFIDSIPVGTSTYPAIARIGVDVPTTLNAATKEFVFDGVADYFFEVTGSIDIWRSGPLDNFNDPITNAAVGVAADGLHTLRLEMVKLSNVSIVNPSGAQVTAITLGDGVTGGTNSGAFFSTGGAAEIGPDGSTANGFLNLFLSVNVAQPLIDTPGALEVAPFNLDPTYTIGTIHNNTVLHLEAVIDKFAPKGITFLQTGGPVGFFAPTSHPLVQDLAAAPFFRPLTEMRFAQFISTELQIVPEPGSVIMGVMAGLAFAGIVWRRKRAAA